LTEALKKVDEIPKMTIPGLIDSMFEALPESLKAQKAEFTDQEEA